MVGKIKKCLTIIGQLLSVVVILSSCSKDESIVGLNPDGGLSYLNVESEGYVVTLSAVEPEESQKGTWRIYSGENGVFDDVNDPKTIFHGEPGEMYRLGWEVSQGKEYKAETITVSFKPLNGVITTNLADTLVNNVSIELEAEPAQFGAEGHWTIVSGEGGRIENADNYIIQFIGKEGRNYELSWTVSFGSKEDVKLLSFYTDTLRANAGINNLDIVTSKSATTKYTTLNAYLPAGGNGTWTLLDTSDAEVLASDDPSSVFKGTADQLYQLLWTVQVDDYQAVDTLQIRFRGLWGMWTDERDDQSYRYVELNGLEWMADNYNYHSYPYVGNVHPYTQYIQSWYYGQTPRAHVEDGIPVEGEEDRRLYGRLYNYYAALFDAPAGWRLPTVDEYMALMVHIQSEGLATEDLLVGGKTGLDLVYAGSISYSNNDPGKKDFFSGQGNTGFYLVSYYDEKNFGSQGVGVSENWGGLSQVPMSAFYTGISVRYVRDVTNN